MMNIVYMTYVNVCVPEKLLSLRLSSYKIYASKEPAFSGTYKHRTRSKRRLGLTAQPTLANIRFVT